MSKLILSRRRFLYVAPAIITASSLMPGHSVSHLLLPPEDERVRVIRCQIFYDEATKLWTVTERGVAII